VKLNRAPQQATSRWQARWMTIKEARRVIILGMLILGVFVGFGRELWQLQVVNVDKYRARAERLSLREDVIPAPRGIIYDRGGTPLVRNVPSFYVTLVPAYLPDEDDGVEEVLIRLAVLLDMPYTTAGAPGDEDAPEPGAPVLGLREILINRLTALSSTSDSFNGVQAGEDELHVLLEWLGGIDPYRPLVLKEGVERDTALLVAQEGVTLPGVFVEVKSVRNYLYGPLVSQLLGFLQPIPAEGKEEYVEQGYNPATDRIGRYGIEGTFEDVLRGTKGRQIVEEDVLGRVLRVVEKQSDSVPGDNVYLTLDLELQRFAEEALQRGMANANSPRGVAIAMNPQTGEILAMVSLPTYDNNMFVQGVSKSDWERWQNDPHRPLLNHAISDWLQPGSVFKIIIASAALQEGVLTPHTRHTCPGRIVVANKYYPNDPGRAQPFVCWNRSGHGSLDVVGAIANSCNIFFYKTGGGFEETGFEGLGVGLIARYAQLFGFGEKTGIELPFEAPGMVPSSEWKRRTYGESWSLGDTYNLSIGEGFLSVTPLQMLNAVNVVANNGTLYRPRIVHHVTDAQGNVTQPRSGVGPDGRVPFTPEISRTLPISTENWSLVRQGMAGAASDGGTAWRVQVEGVSIAGKTGTAQYCDDIALEEGSCAIGKDLPEHAWFAAFAPVEEPEISLIIFLYHGGEGSTMAVPVAHEILEYYFGRDDVSVP
jgi:penicillin-binding protein 2